MHKKIITQFNGYNFSIKTMPEVINTTLPLYEYSNIRFLPYVRMYNDGTFFDLGTTKNWAKHYYTKYLDQNHAEGSSSAIRMMPGINILEKNKSTELCEIDEDACNNFDMNARIEFVYWDEVLKYHHIYACYANRKNADKAYVFYDIHCAKLLKFISYFNKNMCLLMLEGHKMENRTQIPDYNMREITHKHVKKDYALELQKENKNTQLSDREFEILILFANGLTYSKINCRNVMSQ